MGTVDLDAIRRRAHAPGPGVARERKDVLTLLAEVARVAAERDEANARADATRQMAIDANARLRAILLSALDLEDDGKTSLTAYVLATVAERDEAEAEVERLRGVLREVLGEFTDKGSIGAIHNVLRSRWVNVGTVDHWRAAITGEDAEP